MIRERIEQDTSLLGLKNYLSCLFEFVDNNYEKKIEYFLYSEWENFLLSFFNKYKLDPSIELKTTLEKMLEKWKDEIVIHGDLRNRFEKFKHRSRIQ